MTKCVNCITKKRYKLNKTQNFIKVLKLKEPITNKYAYVTILFLSLLTSRYGKTYLLNLTCTAGLCSSHHEATVLVTFYVPQIDWTLIPLAVQITSDW